MINVIRWPLLLTAACLALGNNWPVQSPADRYRMRIPVYWRGHVTSCILGIPLNGDHVVAVYESRNGETWILLVRDAGGWTAVNGHRVPHDRRSANDCSPGQPLTPLMFKIEAIPPPWPWTTPYPELVSPPGHPNLRDLVDYQREVESIRSLAKGVWRCPYYVKRP